MICWNARNVNELVEASFGMCLETNFAFPKSQAFVFAKFI